MTPHRETALALCLTSGLVLLAGATRGQEAASAAPRTLSGVTVQGETVVTAPRVTPLTTPYTESTITADDIRNVSPGASVTIQTLLNTQPSVFAYTDGPLGTGTNVSYRAFNAGQFAETYDGVALNDVFNGGVTNQASVVNNVLLLPTNVDSIILYNGINNPSVNSYNSLGGTINYIPRRPDATFGGFVGGSYGSFNTYETHALINSGDLFGVRQLLAVSHAESDGWTPNTQDRNTNVYYAGAYDAPGGEHVGLTVVYNRNDGFSPFQEPVSRLRQNGGFFQNALNDANEKDKDSNLLGIASFTARLASMVTFTAKVFGGYDDYRRTSYANPADAESATQPFQQPNQAGGGSFWLGNPYGPTYDPAAVFGANQLGQDYHFYGYQTYGVGFSPSVTAVLPNNTVTLGGNVTYGQLHSREYWYGAFNMPTNVGYNNAWDEHDIRLLASGYIQDEIRLLNNAISITPGVKYIFAHTMDHDAVGFYYPYPGTPRNNASFVAPTIGASVKLIDHVSVYGSFGQNIKFPDITAYYNAIPTNVATTEPPAPPVTVKPEHVNDYELGARYQDGEFSAAVNLYREDFTNTFIDSYDNTSGLTQVTNGGSSRYQGFEIQVAEDIDLHDRGGVRAYVNFSYNEAKFTSSFSSDSVGGSLSAAGTLVTAGEPLADVPDTLISVGAVWSHDGWRVNAQGRYVGRQYTDNQASGTPSSTTIPGYFVTDVGVSKTVRLRGLGGGLGKSVKFGIYANNLFNTYYFNQAYTTGDNFSNTDLYATPGAPRSISGSIEVAF